ncbi:MAG: hypothetical protein RJB38_1252 [Pseudomonadota bacterium]|jgi:lipoprotein-releasing system permease protein
MAPSGSVLRLLARKFVLSKSSDGFVSLIAWVSVVGVALGVLALTVVTSVINGFEGELRRVITGMNGDVVLYSRGEPFSDLVRVEKKIRQLVPEAVAVSPSLIAELMAAGPQGVAGVVLEGLDWERSAQVTEVTRRVVAGQLPRPGASILEVALGEALANRLAVAAGDTIRLVIPFSEGDLDAGVSSKVVPVKVAGLIKMGMFEYDSKFVFAALSDVQGVIGAMDQASSMKLKLREGADSRMASDRLSESFGYPFRAKDWGQLNRNLFYAIQLEKAVIALILTAIVIVAAFNVLSTLMMLMHDKSREVAILKAMGFSSTQAFRLFVWIGGVIGLIGALVGAGLGLFANQALAKSHLIQLPADIYYIGFLPVLTRWTEVGVIVLGACVICLLATLYPAIRVARRSPLEGIVDV